MNIYEQISSNKRSSWVTVSIFILFFLFIGIGLDYYYGAGPGLPVFTLAGFLFGGFFAFGGYYYGDKLVLASTHARLLDPSDPKQKQWQNIIEELSVSSGLPLPKTYIINDPDPNAFATGRNPENSCIAVTSGLLNALNRDELQGVAAHEMSHIRNYDIRLMLILTVLVGSIALLSDWAMRSIFYRRSRGSQSRDSGAGGVVILVIWLLAAVLAPLISQLLSMAVSRKREYLADASGAELTRNPIALANALGKIESFAAPTRSINRGTAHLCITDPTGSRMSLRDGRVADLFSTHPPIEKRILALKEMAYAGKS